MPKAIPEKTYDFKAVEDKLYQAWQNAGCFTPDKEPDKQPYTIVIPPPNITGQLHMGHALDETLQDILIRTKRMQGIPALWLPGTDHASIATEVKIVGDGRRGLNKRRGRARWLYGTGLGMEREIRRPYRHATEKARGLLRLVQRTVHHG